MTHREKYGTKKQFISDHFDDIQQLRKTKSLGDVVKIYGGCFSRQTLHNYEKIFTN